MDTETVRVFVASSLEEFQADRAEIARQITELNNLSVRKGLFFELIMCEDTDDFVAMGRKQDEYNDDIRKSQLVFFLFLSKAGQFTLEEFDVALSQYRGQGSPRIAVFVKEAPGTSPTQELQGFLAQLSETVGHYYKIYQHIDSLKLGLVMALKQLGLDEVPFKFEEGWLWQDGHQVLSLEHIPMVAGNQELQALQDAFQDAEWHHLEAKAQKVANPGDLALEEAYRQAADVRAKAYQAFHAVEERVYALLENYYVETAQGKLSPRQVEAYRLLEQGRVAEADEILNTDDILADAERRAASADRTLEGVQVSINEILQKVGIKLALMGYQGDFSQVTSLCEQAVALEERYNLPRKAMLQYLVILYNQMDYGGALNMGERLHRWFQDNARDNLGDRIMCLAILSGLYASTAMTEKAMACLDEVLPLATPEAVKALDTAARRQTLVGLSSALGIRGVLLMTADGQADSVAAEKAFNQAIVYGQALQELDYYESVNSLVTTYSGHAISYRLAGRLGEAETCCNEALRCLDEARHSGRLTNDESARADFAECSALCALAGVMVDAGQEETAERYYMDAIKRLPDCVAVAGKAGVYGVLGGCQSELLTLLVQNGRLTEAEEEMRAFLPVAEELARIDPDTWEENIYLRWKELSQAYYETSINLMMAGNNHASMNQFEQEKRALQGMLVMAERITVRHPAYAQQVNEARETLAGVEEIQNELQADKGAALTALYQKTMNKEGIGMDWKAYIANVYVGMIPVWVDKATAMDQIYNLALKDMVLEYIRTAGLFSGSKKNKVLQASQANDFIHLETLLRDYLPDFDASFKQALETGPGASVYINMLKYEAANPPRIRQPG